MVLTGLKKIRLVHRKCNNDAQDKIAFLLASILLEISCIKMKYNHIYGTYNSSLLTDPNIPENIYQSQVMKLKYFSLRIGFTPGNIADWAFIFPLEILLTKSKFHNEIYYWVRPTADWGLVLQRNITLMGPDFNWKISPIEAWF